MGAKYYKTFGAMWMFVFIIMFHQSFSDYVLPIMATQFLPHKSDSDFMINEYLPQINKVVK